MSTHRCLLLEWQQAVSRPHLADGTQFILIALEEIRSRVAMWLATIDFAKELNFRFCFYQLPSDFLGV